MRVEKLIDLTDAEMPIISALPFSILLDEKEIIDDGNYNPALQLSSITAGNSSYCREDDSAGYFTNSKSDTKKDD